jgi:hypothetical protein
MAFGPSSYFAGVDIYEVLAHEMAYVYLDDTGTACTTTAAMRDLPFSTLIGDPFNCRPSLLSPSVTTTRTRASSCTGAIRAASPWPAGCCKSSRQHPGTVHRRGHRPGLGHRATRTRWNRLHPTRLGSPRPAARRVTCTCLLC